MLTIFQEADMDIRIQPPITKWHDYAATPHGELFGLSLAKWRSKARESLGLPTERAVVIVGHQPIFFHPGILAKFFAGHSIAKQVDGVLVHLVVDHHIGSNGVIELPKQESEGITVEQVQIAAIDPLVAMKDQNRVQLLERVEPFSSALESAQGNNAALQFANATQQLMRRWVTPEYVITSSDLLQTEIGEAIVYEMLRDPMRCMNSYNKAVSQYPDCGITQLVQSELPLWQGRHNEKINTKSVGDLRPRALLLTLLARLTIGDLFVHGTGGAVYDKIMESWLQTWLGVEPCHATVATATLKLPHLQHSTEEVRRSYFSPRAEQLKKQTFVEAIAAAPYGSTLRQNHYQAMHEWLSSKRNRPHPSKLRASQRIANRRDWAFPLYPVEMLDRMRDEISRS